MKITFIHDEIKKKMESIGFNVGMDVNVIRKSKNSIVLKGENGKFCLGKEYKNNIQIKE